MLVVILTNLAVVLFAGYALSLHLEPLPAPRREGHRKTST